MSSDQTTRYAFLDTNTLLHYRFFDEIDWPTELGAERVVLVFTSQVISELDKVKYSTRSSRKADRAQKVCRKLLEIIEAGGRAEVRRNVDVLLLGKEPRLDWAAHDLEQSCGDDRVIAALLSFPFPDEEKVLVCADVKFVVKAEARTIAYHRLRDELALPPEKTPEQRETERLRKELAQYKNRLPVLGLSFRTAEGLVSVLHVKPERYGRFTEAEIESMVNDKRSALEAGLPSGGVMTLSEFSQLQAQVGAWHLGQYREAVAAHLSDFEDYLRRVSSCAELVERTVILDLVLCNQGSAPADDIDITLDFPDGFEVRDGEDMPEIPLEPAEPARPPADGTAPLLQLPDFSGLLGTLPDPSGVVARPRIQRTNSYRVSFPPVQRLKHGCDEELPLLYAVFPTLSAMTSFGVTYEISSATLPNRVCGELHVHVEPSS